MSDLTNFAENRLVDALLRGQALGAPATLHFALLTAVADAEAGTFTEVSGGAYARVAVAASLANFCGTQGAGTTVASSGSSGLTSNNVLITFPGPMANWGLVTHVAVMDASSGGNAWIIRALAQPKNVNAGDAPPSFPAASFSFAMA